MFEQLLQAARTQREPQRLLFLFCAADAPVQGGGRALTPLACVDAALKAMIGNVQGGAVGGYMALGPDGEPLAFD